jgi:hypothetical protein
LNEYVLERFADGVPHGEIEEMVCGHDIFVMQPTAPPVAAYLTPPPPSRHMQTSILDRSSGPLAARRNRPNWMTTAHPIRPHDGVKAPALAC